MGLVREGIGYVYILGRTMQHPPFKIGSTYNPAARIDTISRQVRSPVVFYDLIECEDSGIPLEGWIKKHCACFPRFGEWWEADLTALLYKVRDALSKWPAQRGNFKEMRWGIDPASGLDIHP